MKSFVIIGCAAVLLSSCVNQTLESKANAARKTQIKVLCYQDVIVTKDIAISLAEPAYGSNRDTVGPVSSKTREDGTKAALKTISLYQKEINDSLVSQLRPYDVKLSSCSQPGTNGLYSLEFLIHRAFAERAPVGLYKTGVGVTVKIIEKNQAKPIWESEYVAGTEAAVGDAEKANVDAFVKKVVWQLYQADWIEKR